MLYGLARTIYLVYFHPLAKVPGPKLYAFSNIPYLYHSVRGEWPRTLKALHDKYGPVVRFTEKDVSFITATAWKQIYGHKNHGEESFQKDKRQYRTTLTGYPTIITADNIDHRRIRRLLAHAFSEQALRGQGDIVKQYIDLFITQLKERAERGELVDMVRWYNFTTFDIIGDLAFGEPFGCLQSGGYHPWVAMIFDTIKYVSHNHVFKRIPSLQFLKPFVMPKKLIGRFSEQYRLATETVQKRLESGDTTREDFMTYILRHNDEKGMAPGEIIETFYTLIIAGSETTATLLSGVTFNLLTNRAVYRKVVQEVRGAFENEDDITFQKVSQLKYLIAVLTESTRLYPAVPTALPRLTPAGGKFIEGYWIPEEV